MWLNSSLREEPYPSLDILENTLEKGVVPSGALEQVLHGCRQLVS